METIVSNVEDFANNMKFFLKDLPTKFVKLPVKSVKSPVKSPVNSPVNSPVKSPVKYVVKRLILTASSNGAVKISKVKNKRAKSTKKATKVVRKKFLPKKLQDL